MDGRGSDWTPNETGWWATMDPGPILSVEGDDPGWATCHGSYSVQSTTPLRSSSQKKRNSERAMLLRPHKRTKTLPTYLPTYLSTYLCCL